jgi:hypothetical protein
MPDSNMKSLELRIRSFVTILTRQQQNATKGGFKSTFSSTLPTYQLPKWSDWTVLEPKNDRLESYLRTIRNNVKENNKEEENSKYPDM